jgi:phage gp36-like protein
MPYCAKSDLLLQISEAVLIQLTDDNGQGAVVDSVITTSVSDADDEIDSYCGGRYTVPFAAAPGIIKKLSVDIAIYNLYARRKGAPEDRKTRYDAAVRLLRDVSRGLVTLGADAPSPVTTGDTVAVTGNDRLFTRDKMSGY